MGSGIGVMGAGIGEGGGREGNVYEQMKWREKELDIMFRISTSPPLILMSLQGHSLFTG